MKEIISTDRAPAAIGPYSQGVAAGGLLFFSGQIPLRADGSDLTGADIETQTRQVMENIKALLNSRGRGFEHVVKTTVYLTDMGDFKTVNEVYGAYFSAEPPARSTVAVAALPRGARVEIEVIAV